MPLDSARSFALPAIPPQDAARPLPVTRLLSAGLSGPGAVAILRFMLPRR
ncbi:hypothetical protein J2X24_001930 [Asticcacaulis solisilvae]|nr:hypothetical protein [Asticcacaulis solisilvae]MDR6800409.1 hypothetical protein [Asticcacaulis sp. BE141]